MNYSRFLVGVQFISIFAILLLSGKELFDYWWFFNIVATIFSIWIFMHNRIGNFNVVPEIRDGANLITSGPYRYIRHPMYSALISFTLGLLLHNFSIITLFAFFIMIVALFLKVKKEELLWSSLDKRYKEYMKNSKMIIPFIL